MIIKRKLYSFGRDYMKLASLYGKTIKKIVGETTEKGLIKHRDYGKLKVSRGIVNLGRKSNNQIRRVYGMDTSGRRRNIIDKASKNRISRLINLQNFGNKKLDESLVSSGQRIFEVK